MFTTRICFQESGFSRTYAGRTNKLQNYKYTGGISYCKFQTSAASKVGGHIGGFYGRILFMKRSIIRYLIPPVYLQFCNLQIRIQGRVISRQVHRRIFICLIIFLKDSQKIINRSYQQVLSNYGLSRSAAARDNRLYR